MKPLLILAGLLMFAGVASADTGNQLLQHCDKLEDNLSFGMCFGYVLGATDAQLGVMVGLKSCLYRIPDQVTNQQAVDIVIKYLKEHPEKRQIVGATLVLKAMSEAFPCPK